LPGGARNGNGSFGYIRINGLWWTTYGSGETALAVGMDTDSGKVHSGNYYYKDLGLSVRCLKD